LDKQAFNELVEIEAIKLSFAQLGSFVVLAQLLGIAVLWFIYSGRVDSYYFIAWSGLMVFLLSGDIFLYRSFRNANPSCLEQLLRWEKALIVESLLVGIGWSLFFFIIADVETDYLLGGLIVLGSLIYNGVLLLGYRQGAIIAMITPPIIISGLIYLQLGFLHWHIGVVSVLLLACFSFLRRAQKTFSQTVCLRFQNEELVSELRLQKEEAEKSNLAKTKFLAAASHDLRQPLQSVSLLSAALDFHIKGEKERSILGKLQNSVDSLGELLNSLLDISKLDADVIQPEIRPTLLTELLQQSVEKFEPVASEKGLIFGCQTASNVWVDTDPQLLARIISNLIENAIRYTESGSVSIVLKQETNQAVILLKDTGIGIRDEDKQNIFTEFYQVDNPERDRQKGLGLGLSIVKRLSDLLGIQLAFESQSGLGTSFKLTCSLVKNAPLKEVITPKEVEAPAEQLTVLIVDDEASVRESMKILFEAWSCSVLVAADEVEAMSAVSKSNDSIDALFVDYRLREGRTGVEVANKLVDTLEYELPVMVITGDTAPEQLREIEVSGFQLSHKPIQPDVLKVFLKECAVKRELDPAL